MYRRLTAADFGSVCPNISPVTIATSEAKRTAVTWISYCASAVRMRLKEMYNWTSIRDSWGIISFSRRNVLHRICLDSRIKIDQLDVTRFIVSPFTAQHVSNVSTSIFRSLRLIVGLFNVLYCSGSMCVGVTVWFDWDGVVSLCRLKH